jgi:hypothetical protein
MKVMTKIEMSSRIAEIEMIIQNAIWKGHKCAVNDEYHHLRIERDLLRCMYFGKDSKFCGKNYRA